MSIAELKKRIRQLIDEVDDEAVLEEVIRLLTTNNGIVNEAGVEYAKSTDIVELVDNNDEVMGTMQNGELVFTKKGRDAIEEAEAEIDRGEFYTHEEAMEMLRNRSYRKL